MVNHLGAFMDRKKNKTVKKLVSCQTERILPHFHGLAPNATEWKISVFPMDLKTWHPKKCPACNVTMLHLTKSPEISQEVRFMSLLI